MCLEDRFLLALYNEIDIVPLNVIAHRTAITETAALSIISRIQTRFPDYVHITQTPIKEVSLSSDKNLQQEVRLFLTGGGFTAINEQELRDYYASEMAAYSRFQKLKERIQEYRWTKWIGSTLLTIGGGFGLVTLFRALKKST
jgi:hypothetical protein